MIALDQTGRTKPRVTFGSLTLCHPDGRPLQGGDLVAGRVYEIDLKTGVTDAKNRKERRRRSKSVEPS
jgi:hypothetical protein